jgi:hypothetical protein
MLDGRQGQSARAVLLLVPAWMVLYGLGLHAAGFFMPRRFKMFGWGYILCGLEILGYLLCGAKSPVAPGLRFGYAIMGVVFGGGHAACGLYLYFTEKRGTIV